MSKEQTETVVALFQDSATADAAASQVDKVLSLTDHELRYGALITRNADDEISISDLKYTGVRDIVVNASELTLFLGMGTIKIALGTAKEGISLVAGSTGRILGLASSVASLPVKRFMSWISSSSEIESIGERLSVGMSALAIEVDSVSVDTVRDTLKAAGGVVTELSNSPIER